VTRTDSSASDEERLLGLEKPGNLRTAGHCLSSPGRGAAGSEVATAIADAATMFVSIGALGTLVSKIFVLIYIFLYCDKRGSSPQGIDYTV